MSKTAALICTLLLTACALQPDVPTAMPTVTTLRVVQTTTVPTIDRRLQTVHIDAPTATVETCPQTSLTRPAHDVQTVVDYAAKSAAVIQRIRVPNLAGEPLETLVFDVEPNGFPGAFALQEVKVGETPVSSYELLDRRLTIALNDRTLEPGCEALIELRFQLSLPRAPEGWAGRTGYFGYTDRQLNLGRWLPVVAYRQNGDWVVHETLAIGEQSVAEVADWLVTVQVMNAPEGTIIVAPGDATRPTADSERFALLPARDFALSISDQFEKRSVTTSNGIAIDLYSLGDTMVQTDRGLADGAEHALEVSARSLEIFSSLFGDYLYDKLVVVEGDFADGMEFSGLIFVGASWFRNWNGTPQSYLTIITTHEVAHQWWYASVGSDQATTPWLDEALATYSELIFYQEAYPDLGDWWWQFRVYTYVPAGFTDIQPVSSGVYRFDDVRAYINAVYLRGAQMLDQLRADMGTEAFFDWLAAYAAGGRERIATPDTLWALLTPQQEVLTQATRIAYLGN
jgi:hypothetical protein